MFNAAQELSGEPYLPGFRVAVAELLRRLNPASTLSEWTAVKETGHERRRSANRKDDDRR